MSLVVFDLDHTLLTGDSDYAWGQFLVERGIVDREAFGKQNERFFAQYQAGRLDILDYLKFALRPLAEHDRDTLDRWHREFMDTKIQPMITAAARDLIDQHRVRDDTLIIITATNSFITRPIAQAFNVQHLIATEPEVIDNRFTGRVVGIPSYREGKVKRLRTWLTQHDITLDDSWFYSDSHNDFPLFDIVAHPVAVNPDATLRQRAQDSGWPIIEFR